MSDSDWFRNTKWTPTIAEAFERKLSRSRNQRGEYLRIQALTLVESKTPEYALAAIDLARRNLDLEPQGIFAAQIYAAIAKACEMLGDFPSAVEAYRTAIALEHLRPNVRGYHYLDFAWFVAVHELPAHFEEALAAIAQNKQDQDLIFPANQYRYFGSLALILAIRGEREDAKRMAESALKYAAVDKGPFWRLPQLGLVGRGVNPVRARLAQLAG